MENIADPSYVNGIILPDPVRPFSQELVQKFSSEPDPTFFIKAESGLELIHRSWIRTFLDRLNISGSPGQIMQSAGKSNFITLFY